MVIVCWYFVWNNEQKHVISANLAGEVTIYFDVDIIDHCDKDPHI